MLEILKIKRVILALGLVFCVFFSFSVFGQERAADDSMSFQPSIIDGRLSDAGAEIKIIGGNVNKEALLICELRIEPSEGPVLLFARQASNPFVIKAGENTTMQAVCPKMEKLPLSGESYYRVTLENNRNMVISYLDLPFEIERAPFPIGLEKAEWVQNLSKKDSVSREPLGDEKIVLLGRPMQLAATLKNSGKSEKSLFIRAVIIKSGLPQNQEIIDGQPVTIVPGNQKEYLFSIDKVKSSGTYLLFLQVIDASTKQSVSPMLPGRFTAIENMDSPFMEITDVILDKQDYAAGDKAKVTIRFHGLPSPNDAQISVKFFKADDSDKHQDLEAGSASVKIPTISPKYTVEIPVNKAINLPSVNVIASQNGKILSEFNIKGLPRAAVVGDPLPKQEAELNNSNSLGFLVVAMIIALIAAIFIIWKIRRPGLGLIIIFGFLASFFIASPIFAWVLYDYDEDVYWDYAGGYDWDEPYSGGIYKPGDTVHFKGRLEPWAPHNIYNTEIIFWITEDKNSPSKWVKLGELNYPQIIGQRPTDAYVHTNMPIIHYDQTYTIPAGADWDGPSRFWFDYSGDHTDCLRGYTTPCWPCRGYLEAYQRVNLINNDAQFISQSVPAIMETGVTYSVTVTMKNTGTKEWTFAKNYNLGSQNPADNMTWGLKRISVDNTIAIGQTKTFTFDVLAPSEPGTYNFNWRMIQEGYGWFGDLAPNVAVVVKQPVMIQGSVKDEKGMGIPNVTLDLCGAGTATTDAFGNWSKSSFLGDSYCVKISSGLPAGYNWIHGISNNSCHTDAVTYENQVAGQNKYVNCTYSDQRSWDLASDNAMNFTVNYCECGAWTNMAGCAAGSCLPLQRQRTRSCVPAACDLESECQNDATCCTCTPYVDDDCGLGGCPNNLMRQIRTCNPAACQGESQCVASAVCPRTLGVNLLANPASGPVPLATVLTSAVSGTEIGTINYTAWWDCDDTCSTVAACQAACGAWDDKADGLAVTTRILNHTYTNAGTFHPKMIVERHNLTTAGTVAVAVINQPPTVNTLTKQVDYCASGLATMFSWAYFDPENDPQTFRQVQVDDNAGFSSPEDDTGKVATATSSYVTLASKLAYDTTYHWRLKVWDSTGNDSGWVNGPDFSTPEHSYPQVAFSLVPASPRETNVATYTDQTRVFGGASVTTRFWEIQDATPNSSVAESPVVVYATKGNYVTKLTITDSNGYTCSLEKNVSVKPNLTDWEEQ